MDKSSFSSWLHTAAGGLTCHGRIQPLIHLCFPQVFLNFTHGGGAITESKAASFPCQGGGEMKKEKKKTRAWPVQPEANSLIREPRSRRFVFSLFDCDRGRKGGICHFQTSARLFTLQFGFELLLLHLLLLPPLPACQLCRALPSNAPQPLHAHLPHSATTTTTRTYTHTYTHSQPGLSIYLCGAPLGPKHP